MVKVLRKVLVFLFILGGQFVAAQNISIESFKLLENDLTANLEGTKEYDQNGDIAALIKVITTEQGFVFDNGMVGIVKTQQRVGEVWVYVPQGTKKIMIRHQQLGSLKEYYYFDVSIEKARTYEMKLTTGKVETFVKRSAGKQYVEFNVIPINAMVEIDDVPLEVDNMGYAEQSMPYGTYNYRVSCANYHTEAGKIVLSAEGKVRKEITLRPNFGWIDINGSDEYHGAHVYVDNERIGQLPLKTDGIKSGVHRIKVQKSLYKPYERQILVEDSKTTSLTVTMTPNFASVTFIADAESEIWVDEKLKGKGQCTINLELGKYTVEVKKPSHRTVSEVVNVTNIGERTIQLPSPMPIYGVLDVTSVPSHATIYIDGIKVGEAPLIKDDILLGMHKVVFEKEGYASVEKRIELVDEGIDVILSAELPKVEVVTITSEPSGASVMIDGVYKGNTPLTETFSLGEHSIVFSKSGYFEENINVIVDGHTNSLNQKLRSSSEEVRITTKPSEAKISIDGSFKGYSPLTTTLARGNHLLVVQKEGYNSVSTYKSIPTTTEGEIYFKLDKAPKVKAPKAPKAPKEPKTEKEKKEKIVYSKYYKNLAWYIEGNANYDIQNSYLEGWSGGLTTGLYLLGLNAEVGYLTNEYSDALALKFGYGFRIGRRFLMTPQIGFEVKNVRFVKDWGDWNVEYYDAVMSNIDFRSFDYFTTASCRFQFCFNRFFALCVTPEYNWIENAINVKAGLVINLGL